MKLQIFTGASLLGLATAFAAPNPETVKATFEAQACGSFVQFDDQNLYLGGRGGVRAVPFDGSPAFGIASRGNPVDGLSDGTRLWVLTPETVEEWDLAKRSLVSTTKTYARNGAFGNQEQAQAFARSGNKLVIAHGRLGVSFYDVDSRRITNQFRLVTSQAPLESMATGVAVHGKYAYVVMDNFHLVRPPNITPFRGIVVIDLETEKVIAEHAVLDPGATSVLSDGRVLLVNYGGLALWKFDISTPENLEKPRWMSYILKYPLAGRPAGKAAMDEKYYYTCFLKAPAFPGENGGRYQAVTQAVDRRVFMMD